jgi:hypothetical protein
MLFFFLHLTFQSGSMLSPFPTTTSYVFPYCPARAVWTAHLTTSNNKLTFICDMTPCVSVNIDVCEKPAAPTFMIFALLNL